MNDDGEVLDFVGRNPVFTGATARPVKEPDKEEKDEEICPAFGFLRGVRDRALAVEFRLRDGNSEFFPYSWLGPFRYNPSVGLLLRFTGDTITLVLIRGSNLNAPVRQGTMTLIDRGLQRHRVTFIREMGKNELDMAGGTEPTIDRIDIVEFESQEEVQEWLRPNARAFVRGGK